MWFPVGVTVTVDRYDSPDAFLERVGPFLAEREAEHNLLFGIVDALRRDASVSAGPAYLAAVSDGGRVVAAALRTPPNNLVLSEIDEPDAGAAIDAIVVDRIAAGDPIPGAIGPVGVVRAFAERWAARTGASDRRLLAERAFRISRVIAPPAAPGSMRTAGPGDRDLLIAWLRAFMAEALPEEENRITDAEQAVDRWLRGSKVNYLWEVGGGAVSWAGVGGRTPNGTRVGPVYTPPERRGRGYASSLVAAASQAQLDAGLRFCFLFTDLANPTSNHIYQAIGYEPVTDVEVHVFG
jgi:uncharacterized protein